jgi:hypothetical protein
LRSRSSTGTNFGLSTYTATTERQIQFGLAPDVLTEPGGSAAFAAGWRGGRCA